MTLEISECWYESLWLWCLWRK